MENRHIEAKGDTLATATTDMDNLQWDIETTNKKMIYKDDVGTLHTLMNAGEAEAFGDVTATGMTLITGSGGYIDPDLTAGRVCIVGASDNIADDGALLYDAANNILQADKFGSPTDTDTYISVGPAANQIHVYLNAIKCYAFSQGAMDIFDTAEPTYFGTIAIGSLGEITISNSACSPIYITPGAGRLHVDSAIWAADGDGLGLKDDAGNGPTINDGGYVKNSAQPSFLVYPSATLSDVTGDGTDYTVVWNTEIRDQSASFASNIFTAPIAGVYHFDVQIVLGGIVGGSHTGVNVYLVTSNRTYRWVLADPVTGVSYVTGTISVDADMDINDTAYITTKVSSSTKVVDVLGGTDPIMSYFSGHLVC